MDTYNTSGIGVPNAIRVFKEEGCIPGGSGVRVIRIDSGDIAYLSKEARKMLDEAGFHDCTIMASSGLDEYLIENLLKQGACIDSFGVGESWNYIKQPACIWWGIQVGSRRRGR